MLIKVKNLRLKTNLGIYDWEQNFDREIIINAEIESDYEASLKSDNIEDTISYEIITNNIKNLIANNRFKLVEKMAQEILEIIMIDPRVKRCKVELDKIGAIDCVESFAVVIEKVR